MSTFKRLQAALVDEPNLSELSRECGISRDHLRRIRNGIVSNCTLDTASAIEEGIARLSARRAAQSAAVAAVGQQQAA